MKETMMNLSEFKAWFEGFTEDMDGEPSAKQWKRIKKRVGEITDAPTPYPVFVERYYRPYQRWWCSTSGGALSGVQIFNTLPQNTALCNDMQPVNASFTEVGRAEQRSLQAA